MLVKFYVSRPQTLSNVQIDGQRAIEENLALQFGGFTKFEGAVGAWLDTTTIPYTVVHDIVDIYEVMPIQKLAAPYEVLREFAKRFGVLFNQRCVPFTILDSENEFMTIP